MQVSNLELQLFVEFLLLLQFLLELLEKQKMREEMARETYRSISLIAAAANVIGGLMVTQNNWAHRSLRYFIAVGSGFMLGTVFLGMIPESVETAKDWWPALLLGGYLLVHFFEHTFATHLHFGEETHHDEMNIALGVSAFIGMLVHTLFDGVAIAAAFSVSKEIGRAHV